MRLLRRVLGVLVFFVPSRLLAWRLDRRGRRARAVLTLQLSGTLSEEHGSRRGERGGWHPGILDMLRLAGEDASVQAIALRIGSLQAGWGQLDELRTALLELRRKGRTVFAYLDRPGHAEYFLATAADHVAIAPMATLELLGLRAEVTFFKGALDLLGVTPHFQSAGEFKSFSEVFTREDMSPQHREALDVVLRAIHEAFVAAVASSRDLSPESVQALVDRGPWTAEEAEEQGLVDEVLYPDQWKTAIREELGEVVPDDGAERDPDAERHEFVGAFRWLRGWRLVRRLEHLVAPRPRVAVLIAEGSIVETDASEVRQGRIARRPLVSIIRSLRKDPDVAAVVLRINSPGGSGLASDMIWRELRRLRKKKPLVASMGSVAASGGYYLAMAADEILAAPLTITGSIGVVAGKFDVGALLAKVGITQDVLAYGANSGIQSPTQGLTEQESERLQVQIGAFYDAFVEKAADCRGVEPGQLERHARGRIWTGTQAVERNLIDGTGGLSDAIRRAGVRAKLGTGYAVWYAEPPRPGLIDRLQRLPLTGAWSGRGESRLVALLDGVLGIALGERPDPVQARLPFDLRIR